MIRMFVPLFLCVILAACAADRCGSCNGCAASAPGVPPGAVIHYVKLRSGLPEGEAMAMLHQRLPRFREVPGLLQKVYGREEGTGEICGIYIFESQAALDAFRESELARTIREAYQVESARIERYEVLFTLHPGIRAK
jgi:hypothetical protein